MHPAIANSLSRIRNTYRSAKQRSAETAEVGAAALSTAKQKSVAVGAEALSTAKQKPVAVGAAALGLAAVTGVSLGAAFGPSAGPGTADRLSHPVAVSADAHQDGKHSVQASARHSSPAGLPKHPAASAQVATPAKHHVAAAPKHQPAAPKHQPAPKHAAPVRHTKPAVARHPAARHPAARHQAPARHRAAGHPAVVRHARPVQIARPYQLYDSVTPGSIPAHQRIATYATGNYAVSPAQVAGHGPVMWIDTTGSDYAASVLDVEPGDATPSLAANWAYHRLSQHRTGLARIYTMISEWPAVKAAVHTLPTWMQSRVRWWIADPTGSPHVVPGAAATQWYWGSNYDITNATPRF